uniref:Uncharacterized protein n=1 Tax=Arundo donax TaxID=35708 RepID=A0A0A9B652_ARUDO
MPFSLGNCKMAVHACAAKQVPCDGAEQTSFEGTGANTIPPKRKRSTALNPATNTRAGRTNASRN